MRVFAGALFLAPSANAAGGRSEEGSWLFAVLFGVFALVAFREVWRNLRRARDIEDTPTAKVASAAQGSVELFGRAVPIQGKTVVCPLTGTSCLWYSFKVQRHERQGKHHRWVTVSSGRSADVLGVEDESGTALVLTQRAEVTARHRRRWKGMSPSPSSLELSGGFSNWFGSYRYTEELILPGDPLYVLGWFTTVNNTPSNDKKLLEKLRRLKEDRPGLLARYDADRSGDLSVEEWDAARAAAEAESHSESARTPVGPDVHTVTPPPEDDMPFLVSALTPQELASRYRGRAALGLIGFLGFAGTALWLLLHGAKGL